MPFLSQPGLLDISLPEMSGTAVVSSDGTVSIDITHDPLPDESLMGGRLVLKGWQFRAITTVAISDSAVSLDFTASGTVEMRPEPGDEPLTITITATATVDWDETASDVTGALTMSGSAGALPSTWPVHAVSPCGSHTFTGTFLSQGRAELEASCQDMSLRLPESGVLTLPGSSTALVPSVNHFAMDSIFLKAVIEATSVTFSARSQ